jgi:uncharacterized protein (TIGR02271 family)
MANLIKLEHDAVGPEESFDGYDAYDSTGEKLGAIDDVIANEETMRPVYLVVDTGGWFRFGDKFVVPMGEVQRVDDGERHVYFKTLSKQTLESGTYPKYDASWWERDDYPSWNTHERELARTYQPQGTPAAKADYSGDLYKHPQQGAQRLQLMEERLKANKVREQAGTVKLGKRITEHAETMQVPVTEERVVIERMPASGQAARGAIGADQTVEVPVARERVTAEKETVVREEVGLRKEAVQHTEQVQDTVRSEQLDVKDGQELMDRTRTGRTPGAGYMPDSPSPADKVDERTRR